MHEYEEARCAVCGNKGPFFPFFPGASLRESPCSRCGARRRNRDVARVLMRHCLPRDHAFVSDPAEAVLANCLDMLAPLRIHEFQAQGVLHETLKCLPGYSCSEYLPDTPPGKHNAEGIRCEDATCLTFADASFDVVISQDIMEHVDDARLAFAQIHRVLRAGGGHVFTVPVHEGFCTRRRARQMPSGEVEHLLPPVYHKDPLNPKGALVFWDYGDDLPELLARQGISAHKALHARLYTPEGLCRVDEGESYVRCREASASGRHAAFFLYNSVVFIAER